VVKGRRGLEGPGQQVLARPHWRLKRPLPLLLKPRGHAWQLPRVRLSSQSPGARDRPLRPWRALVLAVLLELRW